MRLINTLKMISRDNIIASILPKIENGIYIEIGTFDGSFADKILSYNNDSILYCIDPYIKYDDYNDGMNNIVNDEFFNEVQNRLENKYGNRVKFIRKFSSDAINLIPDNLDFIYIDGNHQYKYVLHDLELYYPKLKQNAYIVGDDAHDTDDSKRNADGDVYIKWTPTFYGHYGVVKAFTEFKTKYNIEGEIMGNQYVLYKK